MAKILIANARLMGADALADVEITGGRISRVEPSIAPSDHDVVDLDGRWLMPGLWDHHVHFTQWAIMRRRLDLSPAASAAAAAQIVAARLVAELNTTEPLIGYGYRDALWPDVPTAAVLDEVSPHRPVIILSGDMHACWVNTAAASRYGLAEAGVLREGDAFALQVRLEEEAPEDEDLAVSEAAAEAAARGVVGIVDLEMAHNLEGWTARMRRGLHAFRVRSGFYPSEFEARIAAGLRTGDVVEGTSGLLTIGALKLITDGSLNTRTAYCHAPYPGTDSRGMLTISSEDTVRLLTQATAQRFDVAVHAIGDAAVTLALDAFAATGARGTIEHAQLVRAEDLARFAAVGAVASVQPEHLWDDRDATVKTWPDRADRTFPFAALRDAGATIVLGSDAPVAPLDPWRAITAAVHRSNDEREPWNADQSLTRHEALAAAMGVQSITPGEAADLVAVDLDPHQCETDDLVRMPVALTMVDGRVTHRAV